MEVVARGRIVARDRAHTLIERERALLTHLCKKVLHSKFLVCCAASVGAGTAAAAAAAAAFGLCSLSFRSIQVGNFNFKLE